MTDEGHKQNAGPFGSQSSARMVGKNKCLAKGGKKKDKKELVDLFSKKGWYNVKTLLC